MLVNNAGAPGAPGITQFDTALSGIAGLRACFRVPGPETVLDGAGKVDSVASFVHPDGQRAFGTNGAGMAPTVREGVQCMELGGSQLNGPVGDFGDNSQLSLFALFHIPPGEGSGVIFGDASGTRMAWEVGSVTGAQVRIRARSSATVESFRSPGWHWGVFQHDNGAGVARLDGGLTQNVATAVDGNVFQVGSTAFSTTIAIAAFGYALAPMISNGDATIVEDWFRYIVGART